MFDVLGPEKRRRRSVQEKIAIVQQSFEPGMTVSLVAVSMVSLPVSCSSGVGNIRKTPSLPLPQENWLCPRLRRSKLKSWSACWARRQWKMSC